MLTFLEGSFNFLASVSLAPILPLLAPDWTSHGHTGRSGPLKLVELFGHSVSRRPLPKSTVPHSLTGCHTALLSSVCPVNTMDGSL